MAVSRIAWSSRDATGALFAGLLLPPLAWLADLQVSYAAVRWTCQHDVRWFQFLVPAISLSVVALACGFSWRGWTHTRRDADEAGERPLDRNYLLAVAGLLLGALFAVLIATSLIPRLMVSPCA